MLGGGGGKVKLHNKKLIKIIKVNNRGNRRIFPLLHTKSIGNHFKDAKQNAINPLLHRFPGLSIYTLNMLMYAS